MPRKVVVKLPLDKQVVNNNYSYAHWTAANDEVLLEVINAADTADQFKIPDVNVTELSTRFQVPIDFILKRMVKLYNEQRLRPKLDDTVVRGSSSVARSARSVASIPPLARAANGGARPDREDVASDRTPGRFVANKSEVVEEAGNGGKPGKIEVNNGAYSYYIDNHGYSDGTGSERSDDGEDQDASDLMRSSQFFLHRSKMLPVQKLANTHIDDLFNDNDTEDDDQDNGDGQEGDAGIGTEETRSVETRPEFRFFNTRTSRFPETKAQLAINDEDVNGIITTKNLNRTGSGASDLSNRSELEKALLDRL